jgi:predicted RNase H-like HicB family nuclease
MAEQTKSAFKMILDWDVGAQAWVTCVPSLGGISTFGNSLDEAILETREMVIGYLEAVEAEGLPRPDANLILDAVKYEPKAK